MNITLSADKDLVENARRYAQRHGTSLNQLIRDYLRTVTGEQSREEAAEEFAVIAREMPGDSGGRAWAGREDVYRERIDCYGGQPGRESDMPGAESHTGGDPGGAL